MPKVILDGKMEDLLMATGSENKLMCAVNRVTGRQSIYRDKASPEYVVARAYYLSIDQLHIFNEIVAMGIPSWMDRLTYTKNSVMMGDWMTPMPPDRKPLAKRSE